ncbi:MAG: EAL domain-containing protein, partial [Anaerocolumna sp.]
ILKIDLALIQGIHNNLDKQELVRNIVSFSHSKGIKIVAEGIEEVKDLEMVINLDIDYIQGYYLSKPTFYFDDIPQNIKDEIVKFN